MWNLNNAESTGARDDIDFLSNGFQYICNQIITVDDTLIYGAWAENPFAVGSTPACAI